jgi:hypothetical protein
MTSEKPGYLPDFGPDDCLWLVTVVGQWPVHAHTTEASAIYQMNTLRDKDQIPSHQVRVRVTKVTISTYEQLEHQREVIREALVPVGEAITS